MFTCFGNTLRVSVDSESSTGESLNTVDHILHTEKGQPKAEAGKRGAKGAKRGGGHNSTPCLLIGRIIFLETIS